MDRSERNGQARIYYIGPCSKNPYSPSWADLPNNHNETELYISKSIPLPDASLPEYEQRYSEEWQERNTGHARTSGSIDILDLVSVMAREESYSEILPKLWDIYGFSDPVKVRQILILSSGDKGKTWEKEETFKADQVHTRAMAWFWLLWRWITDGNCYFILTGAAILPHEKKENDRYSFYFVKLDDLKKCLNGITKNHKIDFPLPKLLFPEEPAQPQGPMNIIKNAFIRKGDFWEIWYQGNQLRPIKTINGFTYIANLLLNTDKMIHVTALCDSVNPQMRNQAMMREDDVRDSLNRGYMNISTMQDDGLTNKAKEELAKKIKELKEIKADYDLPESERQEAEQELEALMKTLSSHYGKGALTRRAPKKVNEGVKKDLDRALKAIKRAYEKIHKQSPELYEHLKKNIKTGTECVYSHSGTLWHISY